MKELELARPFASAPSDQVKAEAPESSTPTTATPATPAPGAAAPKLGKDGAKALLEMLFGTADAMLPVVALRMVERKVGAERARVLAQEVQVVARLEPGERAELEPLLVDRLAELDLDPEFLLYFACGKILVRMGSGLVAVIETGKAPAAGSTSIERMVSQASGPATEGKAGAAP